MRKMKESPDEINSSNYLGLSWDDDGTIAFGFENNLKTCRISTFTHGDIGDRDTFEYPGRLWVKEKIISFWIYPKTYEMMKKLIKILEQTINTKYKLLDSRRVNKIRFSDIVPIKIWDEYKLDIPLDMNSSEVDEHEYGKSSKIIKLNKFKGGDLKFKDVDHNKSPILKGKRNVPNNVGSKKRPGGLSQTQRHQTTSTSEGMIKLKDLLFEDTIASILKKINIIVDIDRTYHASQQQGRHINYKITNTEIEKLVDLALPEIAKNMMFDLIDMNKTYILIKGLNSKLNVVGIMKKSKKENIMDFIVVTVMRKENFKEKKNTIVIQVRD